MPRLGALCLAFICLLAAGCGEQASEGEAPRRDDVKRYESRGWDKEEAEGAAKAEREVEAEEATNAEESRLHQREREDLPAVEAEEARSEGG